MLNFMNREDLWARLALLREDKAPVFGRMSARHMVEHLLHTVMISTEKLPEKLYFSEERAAKIKAHTIDSDKEIIIGFRAPMLPEEPVPLRFSSLHAAIGALKEETAYFDFFFARYPEARPTNPSMGPLNHREWIIFHSKHFNHHFKQFGLAD